MATAAQRAGREQRAASDTGRAHQPNYRAVYNVALPSMVPGDFEFTLDLLRGQGLPVINLDEAVEGFDWADTDAVMTGTVNLRRPGGDPKALPVGNGHRIRCRARWGDRTRWYEVWTMRCAPPTPDPMTGGLSVPLKDDLDLLRTSKRKYRYRKTKARGRGWRADEAVRAAAKLDNIRLGAIAKGTKRFDKIAVEGSFLDLVKEAYKLERAHSSRQFVLRRRDGLVEIVPYKRNSILFEIDGEETAVSLTGEQAELPVTVIEARGRIGKGASARKIKRTVFSSAVVRRFGKKTQSKDYGRVEGASDLLLKARRDLAKAIRVKRTAELTIPGVPFIRRGDGIRWVTDEPGWQGSTSEYKDRSFAFTTGVSHSVGAGGVYDTTLTIVQDDPFVKDKEREDKEQREKRRAERRKRKRS